MSLNCAARSDLGASPSPLFLLFRVIAPAVRREGSNDSPKQEETFMKIEQAKQIAGKAIEELSHALEAGHSEKLREYLGQWRDSIAIRCTTSC